MLRRSKENLLQATTNVNALIIQFTSYDLSLFLYLYIFMFKYFYIFVFFYLHIYIHFLFVPPNHVDFKSLQYMGLGT